MSDERDIGGRDLAAEAGDPRQFGLIDLFAMVTLAALVSAMAAPLVRQMQADDRNRVLISAGLQAFVTVAAVAWMAVRRKQLLDEAGRRIGIAYSGEIRWRHWPLVKSSVCMLLLAALQLSLAVMIAIESSQSQVLSPMMLYQLQLGYFAGMVFSRFLWRVYPGAMEFFDHGISLAGTTFIPWPRVDVRPSQFFADRIVVVIRPEVGSIVADTKTVQITDSLREKVFATASAQPSA